ncbi:hypothetical protein BGZ76_008921 [Entomortierella beljakovae]|nr:hypothetical protein BGZ76_008921 [Entomortierella beljakovae]
MSQFPTDHQRTMTSSNNNPYHYNSSQNIQTNNNNNHNNSQYSINSNNNHTNNNYGYPQNNNNPYGQFQEGHINDNADWSQLRDPTKYSTGSVSSFKSWTSEDPAYSSQTTSFNSNHSSLAKPQRTHHNPRGDSLSMSPNSSSSRTSGRYRSNSNLGGNVIQNNSNNNININSQGQYDSNQAYGNQNHPNHHRISHQERPDKVLLHHQQQQLQLQQHQQQQQQLQQHQQHQQQQESSRASQRTHRRRDPSAGAGAGTGTGDETNIPSLDDYEAMLNKMTSPNLGPRGRSEPKRTTGPSFDDFEAMLNQMTSPNTAPKESRSAAGQSANRRQERELREPRSERPARQTRRQQPNPSEQEIQEESHPKVDQNIDIVPQSGEESFNQKKLRRRSSLPSKLKETPALFSNIKRLSSDHLSPLTPKFEPPNLLIPPKESDNDGSQRKRFSWENDSIAPRDDLLLAAAQRPISLQRKNSWQDMGSTPENDIQKQRSVSSSAIPATGISKTKKVKPDPTTAAFPQNGRPGTPNSRSRPITPSGGIRPPPGPAPASSSTVDPRASSPKLGKRSNSNGSNSGSMLQPGLQGSRPRTSSSASVSSMNGFALDRVNTPPPPSSPLPPPPMKPTPAPSQNHYQSPPSSQNISIVSGSGSAIGLGIDENHRGLLGNSDSGVLLPQVILYGENQANLPTPASSLPMSPEPNAVAISPSAAANQAAHMARLKKRVSLLEKELANAEMQLSTRMRDGSELQTKVEQLTAERNSLVSLRLELEEKDKEIQRLRVENESHNIGRGDKEEVPSFSNEDMSRLEQELNEARNEIQRLKDMVSEKDLEKSEMEYNQERIREEMEQQIRTLLEEKSQSEEARISMESELETLQERLQHEAIQYHTLQDSVQRLGSKMARLDSQHANDLQQLRMEHDDVLGRTIQEHDHHVKNLEERHKADTDALIEHARRQVQDTFSNDLAEADAREKVLRARIEEQEDLHDQFEEELFHQKQAQEATLVEKDHLVRVNRSLERHLEMQNLQEQENIYKLEELQKENTNLRKVLADLDIAAAAKRRIRRRKDESDDNESEAMEDDDDESEELQRRNAAQMFEEQQRKWDEQLQLMSRKLARSEEESRKTTEQNESLRVALEMIQAQSSKQSSTPNRSSSVLSPPLSA